MPLPPTVPTPGRSTTITIARFDPERGTRSNQTYELVVPEGSTVLDVLLTLESEREDAPAFEYGCRFGRCGLCSVLVDGAGRLACTTMHKPGQVVAPLANLSVLRDLVIDRRGQLQPLADLAVFPTRTDAEPAQYVEPKSHRLLAGCNDCLACVSSCPEFDAAHPGEFPAPLVFGKLAMVAQGPDEASAGPRSRAASAGIERCGGCRGCKCPIGVPVWKMGVRALHDEPEGSAPDAMEEPPPGSMLRPGLVPRKRV